MRNDLTYFGRVFGKNPTEKQENEQTEERDKSITFASCIDNKECDQSSDNQQVETIADQSVKFIGTRLDGEKIIIKTLITNRYFQARS